MHLGLFADNFLLFFYAYMIIKLRYQHHDLIRPPPFFVITSFFAITLKNYKLC